MRFLCVCEGGNCRSVSMATRLKDRGQEALACGWRTCATDTLSMLLGWADAVVVMQREFIPRIEALPGFDPRKLIIVDVGPDVYGTPCHEGLVQYLDGVANDWARKGFRLVGALGHNLQGGNHVRVV